ncbi:MAG: serine/threonine-protein kinase [Bdellovibrionaceae bacterium]|nr:serine/threonine-protein kinase [Pseudobdellovibrionaceae bacterium]
MIFSLALLASVQQVLIWRVITNTDPLFAYFLIHTGGLTIFLGWSVLFRRQFFEQIRWRRLGLANGLVIALGQVAAPYFYFLGAATTPLYLQSLIYVLYPLSFLLFGDTGGGSRRTTLVVSLLALVISSYVPTLVAGRDQLDPVAISSLFISAGLLFTHKLIQRRQVESGRALRPEEYTFFGFLGAVGFAIFAILVRDSSFEFRAPLFAFSAQSVSGFTNLVLLLASLTLLVVSNTLRNRVIDDKQYFDYAQLLLLTPTVSVIFNNLISASLGQGLIQFEIYSAASAICVIVLLAFQRRWSVSLFFALFYLLSYFYYHSLSLDRTEIEGVGRILLLDSVSSSRKTLVEINGRVYFVEKGDSGKASIQETRVHSMLDLVVVSSGQEVRRFYVTSVLGRPEVLLAISIGSGDKVVLKKIEPAHLERYRKMQESESLKSLLLPFSIVEDVHDGAHYIQTPYVYGVTLDEYFHRAPIPGLRSSVSNELVAAVANVVRINRDLIAAGWVNRDTHAQNVMMTPSGLRLIDYDFLFPLDSDLSPTIDSFGFQDPLHDFYALFYDRREYWKNSERKFQFREHENIPFRKNADAINQNLALMKRLIYDQSYFFSPVCKSQFDYRHALDIFATDLEHLTEAGFISSRLLEAETDLRVAIVSRTLPCVRKQNFFSPTGKPSFTLFAIPRALYPVNLIELHEGFSLAHIQSDVSKSIASTMPALSHETFHILSESEIDVDAIRVELTQLFRRGFSHPPQPGNPPVPREPTGAHRE